jgi:PTS system N-acetylglucosamine-specific IIC component
MFLAPGLFAIHAVLTGLSMVLMNWLGVRLGFNFSAGLIDYVLYFGKATRPWLLIPVGAAYFGVYYAVFRFAIVRFDLKTPGREPLENATPAVTALPADTPRGRRFIEALGGAANLVSVDACTTRLRLVVADQAAVDEPTLKALGARGFVRPGPRDLQVVLGPIADDVAREMRDAIAAPGSLPAPGPGPAPIASTRAGPADAPAPGAAAAILAALGGRANLRGVEAAANRLLVDLVDPAGLDAAALRRAGVRAIARPAAAKAQLILAGDAQALAAALGS